MTNITLVTEDIRKDYNQKLLDFESNFDYPFGQDRFIINHGENYFGFFDCLGKAYILVAEEKDCIIAVAVIVLRHIDLLNSGKESPIWYICDLKIHPSYRGKAIIQEILDFAIKKYSIISTKVYGISMNTGLLESNRLVKLATRLPYLNLTQQETLFFYMLRKDELNQMHKCFKYNLVNLHLLSLSGIKDLVLSSTQKPLQLFHILSHKRSKQEDLPTIPFVQTSLITESDQKESDQNYYMLCIASLNKTVKDMDSVGIKPIATASVISNIKKCDWNFVESYEI